MKQFKQIHALEMSIFKQKDKLRKLYKKVKPEPIEDYVVWDGSKKTTLSKLFGKKSEMILVHNMGFDCAYCTLWADGYNGLAKPLSDACAFVVENDESPAVQKRFKKSRDWKFTLVSSEGSALKADLGVKTGSKEYHPGVSVIIRKNGKLYRTAFTWFGPGDNFCIMWDFLRILPSGGKDWSPKFKY